LSIDNAEILASVDEVFEESAQTVTLTKTASDNSTTASEGSRYPDACPPRESARDAVSLDLDREAGLMFEDVERALRNPDLRETEAALLNLTRERFRTATAPDGSPWPSLAPSTLASRISQGIDGVSPLFATGALFASIESEIGRDRLAIVVGGTGQGGADSVVYHQEGDGVPKREILPLDGRIPDNWFDKISEPIADSLGD